MQPEEDFETWKLILLTVTDDIPSFGSMLPDLKRLMESIEETNYLPGELSIFTKDFIEESFTGITNSLLITASTLTKNDDNLENVQIITDFIKSTIKLCSSKINENATDDTKESYLNSLSTSIIMIDIIIQIFDRIDLSPKPNQNEKVLNHDLFQYFINDLKGIEQCNLAIDSINNNIDKNYADTNDTDLNKSDTNTAEPTTNDSKTKNVNIAETILEKESLKISILFKLIQKVILATTIKSKPNSDANKNKLADEKEKFSNYYNQIHSLIDKIFPVFQKISEKNLRKFNASHLDPIFETITKSYPIDFAVSPEDDFPLILNLLEVSHLSIFSTFLKSEFFEKHLFSLKNISLLCSKSTDFYNNNDEYFESDQEKRKNKKLKVFFLKKEILTETIIEHLKEIQNLHYNKEFGEPLGVIYAFVIENKENVITNEDIKNLWSTIKFVFSADLSSFYKMFDKITKVMNENNSKEFNDFVLQYFSNDKNQSSLTIDKNFVDFISTVALNYKNNKFKEPFIKDRDLIWSFAFDEKSLELKDQSRKKLLLLCNFCSNEMIEKIINEKLQSIENTQDKDEKEFILKLINDSITKDEEIKEEFCNQLVHYCISKLPDKNATNILTSICTTQKVCLEKEQIEQLSNISNKFLTNILLSSGFDDAYIENFFLTTKNVDSDLYELIEKYVLERNNQWESEQNDYLTSLPFEKEDLLWTFSIKKSDFKQKFINKLCEIYSNNDGVLLTDKQMINFFLNKIQSFIDDPEKRENCFQLLQRFINVVDETNPNLIDIKKSDKTDELVTICFQGIKGRFEFSKSNSTLVAYYKAAESLDVPLNQITLLYNENPADTNKTFAQLSFLKEVIDLVPIVGDPSPIKKKHLRNVSPSTIICGSKLMEKLVSFLKDDNANDENTFVLMTLLLDLPTSEPVYNMIDHFYIMKEINFERLFPINHPKFFVYSLNALQQMGGNLKDEMIRAKGVEYLIHSLTRVNSLYLISEIIDYLKEILKKEELIKKHSNQLFEALMRLIMYLPATYQESCLSFIKDLKPTDIPKCDTNYQVKFVEIKKEEKTAQIEESKSNKNLSSELSSLEQFSEFTTEDFISASLEFFNEYINESKSNVSTIEKAEKPKKEEKILQIDNEIPLSHVIVNVIAITLIKKNVFINPTIEVKDEEPSAFLKKKAVDAFIKLPIPSEYFESLFPYLTPSNFNSFLTASFDHLNPPTDTTIQFIIDNLNVNSKYLPFAMSILKSLIEYIQDGEKKNEIFKIIFDNFFVLDRDESIEDNIFESAMFVASFAPEEMITKRIDEIGIPKFNKYRINGKDYKPDKCTTGLKNLGNSCYFNSILQQFYHFPSLRKTLIEYKGDDQLFKALGVLFSQMRDGSLKFVSPKDVIDNWICWDGEKLNPRIQQDASEFTIMMIDKLASVIPNSMFNGKLVFKIEGINQEDQFVTERYEPFSVLILPINQSNTIEECLAAFNSPSFFIDKNQYYADSLKRKIDAKQSDFIQELPDHLILQLKRFEYDYSAGVRKKINSKVTISSEIDVASICCFKEDEEKKNTKYNLAGVIQHMGSAMGGHYYSFVKERSTGMWYKFNDINVTPTSIEDVLESTNGYDTNAYLLFYDRSDLVEIDDSKIDQEFAEQLQQDSKMNSYYYFFMTDGFNDFLNEISKRKELQFLASKLILKVLPYSNAEIRENFFSALEQRLQSNDERSFAASVQNEVDDLSFLILNESRKLNLILIDKIFRPMLHHDLNYSLLKLAIDTFDLAVEKLSDSESYFRVLFEIVDRGMMITKDKDNANQSLFKEGIQTICEKATELMKNGIKKYITSQGKLNSQYVLESLNLGLIARLFNKFEEMPKDYVELLQNVDFLRSLYACSRTKVSHFLCNYIRARDLGLFDVNTMFKTFLEKESIHLEMRNLFITIFTIFGEEGFPMTWSLKFKFEGNYRTPQDVALGYALLCLDKVNNDLFLNHFDKWIPTILLHENADTRNMAQIILRYLIPHKLLEKEFGEIPTYHGSMIFSTGYFNINIKYVNESTSEIKKNTYNLIQCLLGCFKQMKELIAKDDYSTCLSFKNEKYRAVHLLRLLRVSLKIFNLPVKDDTENYSIDFSELIDFGEFLLTTGHSHPFDTHIIHILKILKTRSSSTILANSVPSEELMLNTEKVKQMSSSMFNKYMKIILRIFKDASANKTSFSDDFLSRFAKLIVFNLKNLDPIIASSTPIESLNNILEIICNMSENNFSSFFTSYFDNNMCSCINQGFHSAVTLIRYMKIKRPIAQYVHSLNFSTTLQNVKINFPMLYYETILSSGSPETSKDDCDKITCYETLFDDISGLTQCLCQKGKEVEKDYEKCRKVLWDYLINNTKKRIDECPNESRLNLMNDIYNKFVLSYNFSYFNLLLDFQEQQRELKTITQFMIEFVSLQSNKNANNSVINKFLFLSKNSFGALDKVFDILKDKVPEKLKDAEFVSDCLSNKVFSKSKDIVEKFCQFALDGKTKDELAAIFEQSQILTKLVEKLDLLNFVYENGIIENLFDEEDEEELSSIIVPVNILMKYKEAFSENDDLDQMKSEASSLLEKLKTLNLNCQSKAEVIDTLSNYLSSF